MSRVTGEGPPVLGGGDKTLEELQRHSDASQKYWFTMNAIQNQKNQEHVSESNMQKNAHDALMQVVGNLK